MKNVSRRLFLRQGALVLAGAAARHAAAAEPEPVLRIGLVTDLHHADKEPAGGRHYRDTLRKLAEAAETFEQEKVNLVVELGDIIDSAASLEGEKGYLRAVAKAFSAVPGQHHYVLGNHCVYALTKPEFLEIVGQPKSYYSFDLKGRHFIVLDACFRSDGEPYGRKNYDWKDANVPPAEVEWLRSDLDATPHKSVVFIHQRLDVEGSYGVKNAAGVRAVLERSGKVIAVLQGHYHRNDHQEIGGIHYVTLAAVVEGPFPDNACAILDVLPGGAIRIRGFGKQESYLFP